MVIKILDEEKKIVLVSTWADLDATHASHLSKELKELLAQGILKIIIDLSNIDFVSSAGIGVLASTSKNLAEASGKLVMVCEDEKILSLLEITNLHRLIGTCRSIGEAQTFL